MAYSGFSLFNEQVLNKTVLWLEFFHPFKYSCERLWADEHYFSSFFSPLSKLLHPDKAPPKKPRLKILQCYLTLLRLVYPAVRDELALAIEESPTGNRALLENFQLLFEFFIPLVSLLFLSHFFF
jgi:hypothetical protein